MPHPTTIAVRESIPISADILDFIMEAVIV